MMSLNSKSLQKLSRHEKIQLLALLTEKQRRAAGRDFLSFVLWMMPEYNVNWHHRALCAKLDALQRGEIKKLAVFMPPQHGKSQLVSRFFPAYLLGKNPDLKIASCSYNQPFAQRFNRDVQRCIDSDLYRQVFPETTLNGSNVATSAKGNYVRNADMFEIVGRRGAYVSAGVGSALTGVPVDIGDIDDPIKGRSEAESSTYRDKVWAWYQDVFCARLHKDSQQILTMTRWHEDDLAGRALAEGGWTVVSFPRIREDMDNPEDPREIGDTLWPWRHSLEDALAIMENNPYGFASLQQQRPSQKGGNILRVDGIQRYDDLPRMEQIILSADFNAKAGIGLDNTAIQAWGKSGACYYLIDEMCKNMGFGEMVAALRLMHTKHNPHAVLVEDKANGPAVIDSLKKEIPGLLAVNPMGGKVARAEAISALFTAGNIYIPYNAPFLSAWIEEIMSFPNGKKDDRVDATTQALSYLHLKKRGYFA
jgi:predicted phage terminase large subunit-like protein